MFYVYVLQSEASGRYYIGSTTDVIRRLAEHNSGKTPSTRAARPWHLVYNETHSTLADARRRERKIKTWKNREYMRRVLGLGA